MRRAVLILALGPAACGGGGAAAHGPPPVHRSPDAIALGTTVRFHSVPGLPRAVALRLRASQVLQPAPRLVDLVVTVANRGRRPVHLALQADETDGRGHYTFAVSPDHPTPGVRARQPDWGDRATAPIPAVAPVLVGRTGGITAVLPDHVVYGIR